MLFQELGKLKRSSIMTSIVLMALGIMMVICPDEYTTSLVDVMGYALLIVSTVMILDFLVSRRSLMDYVFFTVSLILLILGVTVLVNNDRIVLVIGLVFGVILILSGLSDTYNALTYARRSQRNYWWVLLILSVLTILFGLIILVNPWWNSPRALFEVIGGILLFSSVVGIVRLVFLWPIKSE